MTGDKRVFTTDIVDLAPAVIAILMLAGAAVTFIYNKLFGDFTLIANFGAQDNTQIIWIIIIVALVLMLTVFIRIWVDPIVRVLTYMAWLLYLPSALYFSGIDLFRILSISANLEIFSSSLSFTVIALVGIMLACGSLAVRSFSQLKSVRESLLARGADQSEVRKALFRNTIFELALVTVAGIVTVFFAFVAPSIGQQMQPVLKSLSSMYLLIGLGAIVLLVFVFLLLLWPRKNGEKG